MTSSSDFIEICRVCNLNSGINTMVDLNIFLPGTTFEKNNGIEPFFIYTTTLELFMEDDSILFYPNGYHVIVSRHHLLLCTQQSRSKLYSLYLASHVFSRYNQCSAQYVPVQSFPDQPISHPPSSPQTKIVFASPTYTGNGQCEMPALKTSICTLPRVPYLTMPFLSCHNRCTIPKFFLKCSAPSSRRPHTGLEAKQRTSHQIDIPASAQCVACCRKML